MNHSARLLRTTLTSALLCACMTVNASAAVFGVGTVTGDSLRLRESASTDSAILTTAVLGDTAVVLEDQSNDWYKVAFAGIEGYMSAEYLAVSTQATADLGTGIPDTDGASLNLRSGPGTGFDKLADIPNDAVLTLTGLDSGWYLTSYNGISGYVSSDYVTLTDTSAALPAMASAQPAVQYGILNTDGSSLNLRSGPGTEFDKVASIPGSAVLTITGTSGDWYLTSYAGVDGYVSSEFITLSDSMPTVNSDLSSQLVAYAKQFLGCPYIYGAAGPSSFDCSGFTSYVFKHFGYTLNRSAAAQYSNGTVVDQSQMQPGDLILWRAYGSSKTATHVGIYIGNNQYIHASSTQQCITINDMDYAVNSRYVVGVRRILN